MKNKDTFTKTTEPGFSKDPEIVIDITITSKTHSCKTHIAFLLAEKLNELGISTNGESLKEHMRFSKISEIEDRLKRMNYDKGIRVNIFEKSTIFMNRTTPMNGNPCGEIPMPMSAIERN